MTILVGQIATTDGASFKQDITPTRYGYESRTTIYTCPATEYRSEQPDTIAVDINHEGPAIGQVAYLAQRGHGLFAVLDVDPDELPDPPWYLSGEIEGRWDGAGYSDVTLHRVAVVEKSATVAKSPAVAVVGDLDDAHLYWANPHRSLLKEAADYAKDRRWRYRPPHEIAGDQAALTAELRRTASAGPLELRSASTADVSTRARTIDIIAAPAGQEAAVIIGGRIVGEVFNRACFAGDEKRADRIRVNRDHRVERTVGRTLHLDPYDQRGCIATLKIAKTSLGDETLALADDRCLDSSVGFRVYPDGETWDAARSRRHVSRGTIDHIALVPDPAYEGANILDVRNYQ